MPTIVGMWIDPDQQHNLIVFHTLSRMAAIESVNWRPRFIHEVVVVTDSIRHFKQKES
jgi:hypothetical protein